MYNRLQISRMILIALMAAAIGHVRSAAGQEPGWSRYVIAPPEMRSVLEATPIENRPYRPLHFWGNTVRRTYYHGSPLPQPRNLVQSAGPLLAPAGRGPLRISNGRSFGR